MTKGLPFTENAIQRVVVGARKTGAIKLPYLSFQTNRHRKEVVFVRRRGCRIRLHQTPGTSEFLNEYKAIIDGLSPPARPTKSDDQRVPHNAKGYVYFLWVGDRIKIGFSRPPLTRIEDLKTGISDPPKMMLAKAACSRPTSITWSRAGAVSACSRSSASRDRSTIRARVQHHP